MKQWLGIIRLIGLIILLIVVIIVFIKWWSGRIEGTIVNIDHNTRVITINTKKGDIRIITSDNTKLLDENGTITFLSYYQRDFKIVALGRFVNSGSFLANSIRILKMPNIILVSPEPYSNISQDFVLVGKARVFENTFNMQIVDYVTKEILLTDTIYANAPDMGQYGDFEKVIHLPDGNRQSVYVTLYDASAKDGSMQDALGFELYLRGAVKKGTKQIQVFFSNNKLDPEISCNKVFPVIRRVESVPAIARLAIEELLKGPEYSEKQQGYTTSIPSGTRIIKLFIDENGLTKIDFSKELDENIGGSCMVSAIRAQITETLKQFPAVKNVLITINGRSEDILQP